MNLWVWLLKLNIKIQMTGVQADDYAEIHTRF